jgi:hypothetical protein
MIIPNPVRIPIITVLAAAVLAAMGPEAFAQRRRPERPADKPLAAPAPKSAVLTLEDWQRTPQTSLRTGEIDRLVDEQLRKSNITPAPLTTDEQFIRRVSLDLTGALPRPDEISTFAADGDPQKRARLIDRLLDSDAYARHWARYWRDVLAARFTERRGLQVARNFELWMAEQLRKNRGWDDIARDMITAEGVVRYDKEDENGAAFMMLGHRGADAANERASEVARVFLGIQIQCAQCHDHPSDQWKRVQFHELASYFARLSERPVRDGNRQVGFELIGRPVGEHDMADKDNPQKSYRTHPRFLDGRSPGMNLPDKTRRQALADSVVTPGNYWFAAAFVNRIWGQLMGQAFYQPVDDMGPKKDVVFPQVLTRMTGSFRATRYDIKGLFRDIMNSETYQRQIRPNESSDQHLHFAAMQPTQLRAETLWDALTSALGQLGGPGQRPARGQGLGGGRPGRGGPEAVFREAFDFDPSLRPEDFEGSISQALLLMNSPLVEQRIQGRFGVLNEILRSHTSDKDAIGAVYMQVLARPPSARELTTCRDYVVKIGNRTEAFEDIFWSLVNSTEFQTKR